MIWFYVCKCNRLILKFIFVFFILKWNRLFCTILKFHSPFLNKSLLVTEMIILQREFCWYIKYTEQEVFFPNTGQILIFHLHTLHQTQIFQVILADWFFFFNWIYGCFACPTDQDQLDQSLISMGAVHSVLQALLFHSGNISK